MEEKRNACRILVGKYEREREREHLEDLGLDGRIILTHRSLNAIVA
jgi:hypothetical protein